MRVPDEGISMSVGLVDRGCESAWNSELRTRRSLLWDCFLHNSLWRLGEERRRTWTFPMDFHTRCTPQSLSLIFSSLQDQNRVPTLFCESRDQCPDRASPFHQDLKRRLVH